MAVDARFCEEYFSRINPLAARIIRDKKEKPARENGYGLHRDFTDSSPAHVEEPYRHVSKDKSLLSEVDNDGVHYVDEFSGEFSWETSSQDEFDFKTAGVREQPWLSDPKRPRSPKVSGLGDSWFQSDSSRSPPAMDGDSPGIWNSPFLNGSEDSTARPTDSKHGNDAGPPSTPAKKTTQNIIEDFTKTHLGPGKKASFMESAAAVSARNAVVTRHQSESGLSPPALAAASRGFAQNALPKSSRSAASFQAAAHTHSLTEAGPRDSSGHGVGVADSPSSRFNRQSGLGGSRGREKLSQPPPPPPPASTAQSHQRHFQPSLPVPKEKETSAHYHRASRFKPAQPPPPPPVAAPTHASSARPSSQQPDPVKFSFGGSLEQQGSVDLAGNDRSSSAFSHPPASHTPRDGAGHTPRDGAGHTLRDGASLNPRDGASHTPRDGASHTPRGAPSGSYRPASVSPPIPEPSVSATSPLLGSDKDVFAVYGVTFGSTDKTKPRKASNRASEEKRVSNDDVVDNSLFSNPAFRKEPSPTLGGSSPREQTSSVAPGYDFLTAW